MGAAKGLAYDADGNLTGMYAAADLDTDGDVDATDLAAFVAAIGHCDPDGAYNAAADFDGDGCVELEELAQALVMFDQPTGAVRLHYDGENRLVRVQPPDPADGDLKVEFEYDSRGRRIEKRVYTFNSSSWGTPDVRRFVWDEWTLLLEMDGSGTRNQGKRGRDGPAWERIGQVPPAAGGTCWVH